MSPSCSQKELLFSLEKLYQKVGLRITAPPQQEKEGQEYGAYRLEINHHRVAFRIGKITPQRPGHFATLWKRVDQHIVPLDEEDFVSFVIVHVTGEKECGQFIFDRDVLLKKGIFSSLDRKGKGKLGFRVFPPWATPAPSAQKTQNWQLPYFLSLPTENLSKVMQMFKISHSSPVSQ